VEWVAWPCAADGEEMGHGQGVDSLETFVLVDPVVGNETLLVEGLAGRGNRCWTF